MTVGVNEGIFGRPAACDVLLRGRGRVCLARGEVEAHGVVGRIGVGVAAFTGLRKNGVSDEGESLPVIGDTLVGDPEVRGGDVGKLVGDVVEERASLRHEARLGLGIGTQAVDARQRRCGEGEDRDEDRAGDDKFKEREAAAKRVFHGILRGLE